MAEMLAERRAIRPLDNKCRRILFLDNCGGHNETRESAANLANIVPEIRLLPNNSNHLTQPADVFLVQNIKQAWQRGWDAKKVEMIKDGDWKSATHSSGKLKNPGYMFFLKFAAESAREVNKLRDKNGIPYARKSKIRCGLSFDLNGVWRVKQLFPELQKIVKEYPSHFDGPHLNDEDYSKLEDADPTNR
jgi:DDE superfamily endonuclease